MQYFKSSPYAIGLGLALALALGLGFGRLRAVARPHHG